MLENLKKLFLKRATKIHGLRYVYDVTDYKNAHTAITITCSLHGRFQQKPIHHLRGNGCRICGDKTRRDKKRKTTKGFILQAEKAHGIKYDYSKSKYLSAKTPVSIVCSEHGEFFQKPQHHITGSGCPSCAKHGFDGNKNGFLYLLLADKGDLFKIGITNYFDQRMSQLKRNTPFGFKVMSSTAMDGVSARKAETQIKQNARQAGLSGFDGASEWHLV